MEAYGPKIYNLTNKSEFAKKLLSYSCLTGAVYDFVSDILLSSNNNVFRLELKPG